MKQLKNFLAVLFLIAGLTSCKKEENLPDLPMYETYLPLELGSSFLYQVDSLTYISQTTIPDSVHWFERETIDSIYTTLDGKKAFSVNYFRGNDTLNMTLDHVYLLIKNTNNVEERRLGLNTAIISFPVNEGVSWNGNLNYPSKYPINFRFRNLHQPLVLETISLDSTLIVEQYKEFNFIQDIYFYDVYANNIGRVYSERRDIETQPGDKTGTLIKKALINYQR